MTYSGRGRIAAAPLELTGGLCEVAPADRQPAQAGDRRRVVRDEVEGLLVRGLRGFGIAVGDQQIAEQRSDVGGVLGREAGRVGRLAHGLERPRQVAVQLADVGQARERRQVRGQPDHPLDLGRRFLVAAELDQRVDHDAMRRCVVREGFDRGLAGLEGEGELVAPELEASQTDQGQDVVGREVQCVLESGLRRCVERRIRGLADTLQQGQTEVALRGRVVRIGIDPCGQRLDEGLSWRNRCRSCGRGGRRRGGRGRGCRRRGHRLGREGRGSRRAATRHNEKGGKGQGQSARPREHAVDTGLVTGRMTTIPRGRAPG